MTEQDFCGFISKGEGLTDRPWSRKDKRQTVRAAAKDTTLTTIEDPSACGLDVKDRARAASSTVAMAPVSTCEAVSQDIYS
jgi:hypothetical protein